MSQSNDTEFSPWHELQRMLRFSWFIVLAMLLGAVSGEIFHQLKAPVYESKAVITVQIDYSRTGYFTDVQQDQVMETVGDLIADTDVKVKSAELAGWPKDEIESGAFLESFFLERQYFRWILRVRSQDASLTSKAVNAWTAQAAQSIDEGLEHTIIVDGLDKYQASLEKCLEQIALVEPVQAFCSMQNLAEIQTELQAAAKIMRDERVLSKGLFPGISYEITEKAFLPNVPVQRGRNSLILAGMMMGAVLGVAGVSAGLPDRWKKRGA